MLLRNIFSAGQLQDCWDAERGSEKETEKDSLLNSSEDNKNYRGQTESLGLMFSENYLPG